MFNRACTARYTNTQGGSLAFTCGLGSLSGCASRQARTHTHTLTSCSLMFSLCVPRVEGMSPPPLVLNSPSPPHAPLELPTNTSHLSPPPPTVGCPTLAPIRVRWCLAPRVIRHVHTQANAGNMPGYSALLSLSLSLPLSVFESPNGFRPSFKNFRLGIIIKNSFFFFLLP